MADELFFGFLNYADALAKRIDVGTRSASFVLSISGPWGSGKTTLMNEVVQRFPVENFVIHYNPWSSSQRHEVWRTFFVAVVASLSKELDRRFPKDAKNSSRGEEGDNLESLLHESEQALYRAFVKELPGELQLDTGNLLKTGAKLALKFVPWGDAISSLSGLLSSSASPAKKNKSDDNEPTEFTSDDLESVLGVFKRDMAKEHVAQIESLEQFGGTVRSLVSKFTSFERRLLVAIDDIDRCLPEQSLEILEAIKLFLDLPHVGYVIASDNAVVQHGLDIRYKQDGQYHNRNVRADNYIEKMVDLSFSLPTPSADSFLSFVNGQLTTASYLKPELAMVEAALGRTPRSWKRFSNRLALKDDILRATGLIEADAEMTPVQAAVLVKLELLSYRWPHFMREVRGFGQLSELEAAISVVDMSNAEFTAAYKKQDSVVAALRDKTGKTLDECVHLDEFLTDRLLLECLAVPDILSSGECDNNFGGAIFSLDI